MPIFEYECEKCGWEEEKTVPMAERDQHACCPLCNAFVRRRLAAPNFRFAGRTLQGGGPDRFTADVLGLHPKDLPDGLRTDGTKRGD